MLYEGNPTEKKHQNPIFHVFSQWVFSATAQHETVHEGKRWDPAPLPHQGMVVSASWVRRWRNVCASRSWLPCSVRLGVAKGGGLTKEELRNCTVSAALSYQRRMKGTTPRLQSAQFGFCFYPLGKLQWCNLIITNYISGGNFCGPHTAFSLRFFGGLEKYQVLRC